MVNAQFEMKMLLYLISKNVFSILLISFYPF